LTGKSIWELIKKNPTAGLYEEKASGKIPVPVETEAEDNSPTGQQATGKNIFFHCGAIYFLFGCTYVIYVTFLFGIGQIIGPACAGFLTEQSGTFSIVFLLAAILAGTAMVLSLLLPGKKQPLAGEKG
jgi:hypothetical protein